MTVLVVIDGNEFRRYVGRDKKGRLEPTHEAVADPAPGYTIFDLIHTFRQARDMNTYRWKAPARYTYDYAEHWITTCQRSQRKASAAR